MSETTSVEKKEKPKKASATDLVDPAGSPPQDFDRKASFFDFQACT